jgi:glucose dehydrogenase
MITRRDFTKLAGIGAGSLFISPGVKSQEKRTQNRGAADIDNERTGPVANLEWAAYGGDTRNTKYSPASQIDASNASKLNVVWRWSSPDNDIVKQHPDLRGALYVATGFHMVASLDAQSGRTRWIYDPGVCSALG